MSLETKYSCYICGHKSNHVFLGSDFYFYVCMTHSVYCTQIRDPRLKNIDEFHKSVIESILEQ